MSGEYTWKNKLSARLYLATPGMRIWKTVLSISISSLLVWLFGAGDGVTAALTAIVCLQSSFESTVETSVARLKGTLYAGVLGYLTITLFNVVFQIGMRSVLYNILVGVITAFFMHFLHVLGSQASIVIAAYVYVAICFGTSNAQEALQYSVNRILMTALAIIITLLVDHSEWLDRLGDKLNDKKDWSREVLKI